MKFTHYIGALGAALMLSAVAVPVAMAHGSMKPQHHGKVQMSGETVVELVATAKGVDVYITEEDEPLVAAGYTAKLTITAAGQKKEVPLVAMAGNRLTAVGAKIPAGAKTVVALTNKASGDRVFVVFPGK